MPVADVPFVQALAPVQETGRFEALALGKSLGADVNRFDERGRLFFQRKLVEMGLAEPDEGILVAKKNEPMTDAKFEQRQTEDDMARRTGERSE